MCCFQRSVSSSDYFMDQDSMKLSQSKCNICPTTPHPHRKLLARQSLPAGGPRGQCLLPQPHPSCLSLGDQPLGEAPGSLGPPAITAREPLGSVGLLSPPPGQAPVALNAPPAQLPAMPRTTAIVPWASPRALSHRWRDRQPPPKPRSSLLFASFKISFGSLP